jgi:hypothetical protein
MLKAEGNTKRKKRDILGKTILCAGKRPGITEGLAGESRII